MSIHRARGVSGGCGVALSVVLGAAVVGCGGHNSQSKAPQTAASQPSASPGATASQAGPSGRGRAPARREGTQQGDQDDGDDAELVVGRDVIQSCPQLRLVRAHMAEFDPDMVWLAVLESIADCMSEGGPMSTQNIGVSGDEEHRHVVREVLGARGVTPTRVVARPPAAAGAAECQGGIDCSKRVEITIVVP